jgi:hypothetical protein
MNGFEERPNKKCTGSGGSGGDPGLVSEGMPMIMAQIDIYQNF